MARVFVSCVPGLEKVLRKELLGMSSIVRGVEAVDGGFEADCDNLAQLRSQCGVASNVSVRVASFRCRALGELERKSREDVNWSRFLRDGDCVRVEASAHRSRVYHKGAIVERVSRAIQTRLPNVTMMSHEEDDSSFNGGRKILARFDRDECVLSMSEYPALHRRSYRVDAVKAPLRCDVARAVLLASEWDCKKEALLDPMCGSGTFVLEAFIMSSSSNSLFGSDRDEGAIERAIRNASRLNVPSPEQVFKKGSLSDCLSLHSLPECGLLVCNPPFGLRLRNKGVLKNLYYALGDMFAEMPSGWRMSFVAHDATLASCVAPKLKQLFQCRAGGLPLTSYQVVERREKKN